MKWQSELLLTQVKPNTCGDVAIKSLLNHWYGLPLFHRLIDCIPPLASLSQLQRFAAMFGLRLKAFKVDHIARTKSIKTPFVVLTQHNKINHYELVQWHDAKNLKTSNNGLTRLIDVQVFQQTFSGYLMHTETFKKVPLPAKVFFEWQVKHVFVMQWIQVATLFIFTLLFFFMSFGLPFDMFTFVMIMIILNYLFYHSQWLIGLKHFDANIMKHYQTWIHNAEQFVRFQKLKVVILKPTLLLIQSIFNAYLLWFYAWLMDENFAWLLLFVVVPYGFLSRQLTLWSDKHEHKLEQEEKQFFLGNINNEQYTTFQKNSYAYLGRLQLLTLTKVIILGICSLIYLYLANSLTVYALTIVGSILWFWSKNIDIWIGHHRREIEAKQSIYEFIIHR